MLPRILFLSGIALLVAALPASALESVEVLEADGGLNQHLWVSSSPTPGWCYWELAETDGSILPILTAGSGPDQAQLILQPGVYLVTLRISAYQSKSYSGNIDPYLGHVLLKWEDPGSVAVEPVSWSSLKASFVR